jgi:hypothetical protein
LFFASTPIIPLLASRGNIAGGKLQEMFFRFAGAGPEISASVIVHSISRSSFDIMASAPAARLIYPLRNRNGVDG